MWGHDEAIRFLSKKQKQYIFIGAFCTGAIGFS
jgi:hypothetical protein